MNIHVLHGIHTPLNDPVVAGLLPYLQGEGRKIYYPDYGWIAAVETRRINPAVMGTFAPYIGEDDVLIGHSNGCALIYDHILAGGKAKGLVLINGALRRDIKLPDCIKFAHVYYNVGDDITEVARVADEIFFSPVDPVWGDMGHAGYLGTDGRVVSVDCGVASGMPVVCGHSDIFTPAKLAAWGPYIDGKMSAAYLA